MCRESLKSVFNGHAQSLMKCHTGASVCPETPNETKPDALYWPRDWQSRQA